MKWLMAKWHARLRRIDIQILWPSCREQALNLDQARAAFACHALHDYAWMSLGEDEVCRIISDLT